MRRVKALLFIVSSLFMVVPSVVFAEDKVAVVNVVEAIFRSDVAQARLKQAESGSDFVALKAKYESSSADLQALAKEAESKRLTWSQEQTLEHQKKMEYAKADADLALRKIQAENKQLQQKIVQELGPKASEALQEVINEEGVTVLLKSDAVVFHKPESDITAKVADRLNQKTK